MIDPKLLRTDLEATVKKLTTKGYQFDSESFNKLESARKSLQSTTEQLQSQRKAQAATIGKAAKAGEDIAPLKAEGERIKQELDQLAGLAAHVNLLQIVDRRTARSRQPKFDPERLDLLFLVQNGRALAAKRNGQCPGDRAGSRPENE